MKGNRGTWIRWAVLAIVLIYPSLYFYLRPMGKVSSWKNPITGTFVTTWPVWPIDPPSGIEAQPRRMRKLGDWVFYPLRELDEAITGESIRFDGFTVMNSGTGRFSIGTTAKF